ncbi:MAG: CheR family methyltransferase [Alphaproteobacteria bacterium]
MDLSTSDFDFISKLIKQRSGIALTKEKQYLIDSRLIPIAKKLGLNEVVDLIAKLKSINDEALINEVVETMTTNESSFMRDIKPFEQMKSIVIPYIKSQAPDKKSFRIWSAACSNGQEPYSVAMSLKEAPGFGNYKFEIFASDLTTHVLEKAKSGIYTQFEVQRGLPITLLLKYFEQHGDNWKIKDEIKSMVEFQKINLIENFDRLGKFDIILCRNVLIYFDSATKLQILNNFTKLMNPYSVLMLGCTENILGMENKFKFIKDSASIFTLNN